MPSKLKIFAVTSMAFSLAAPVNAQVSPPSTPATAGPIVAVASRLTPPKRRADEAIGAFSEPSVSGEWMTVRSAMPAQDAQGVVHVYRKVEGDWVHFQTLLSPDDRPVDDGFGWATAIDSNTMVVGAPDHEVGGVRSGAVLVYRFDGQQWTLDARVGSPDPAINSYFGQNVALDQGTLVVGEAREASVGGWAPNRAAYVFREGAGGWALEATLGVPADLAAATFTQGSHGFGNYVDVDGDTIAVAARNKAYLYERKGTNWSLHQQLDAPTDPNDSAEFGPSYGRSLDLDGDLLVVAALRAAGKVPDAGAAFVYRRHQGQWQQEAKLTATDGATRDMFGHWVATDQGTIVSGAFFHSVEGHRSVGAAYVYRQIDGGWTEVAKVVPPEPQTQFFTAYSLAFDDNTLAMSAGERPDRLKSDYFWTFDLRQLR